MEANSFQMCQGTREPREPPVQWSPAMMGRLGWAGPPTPRASELPRQLGRFLLENCMQIHVCREWETP